MLTFARVGAAAAAIFGTIFICTISLWVLWVKETGQLQRYAIIGPGHGNNAMGGLLAVGSQFVAFLNKSPQPLFRAEG